MMCRSHLRSTRTMQYRCQQHCKDILSAKRRCHRTLPRKSPRTFDGVITTQMRFAKGRLKTSRSGTEPRRNVSTVFRFTALMVFRFVSIRLNGIRARGSAHGMCCWRSLPRHVCHGVVTGACSCHGTPDTNIRISGSMICAARVSVNSIRWRRFHSPICRLNFKHGTGEPGIDLAARRGHNHSKL